jgi:hypothetical protein
MRNNWLALFLLSSSVSAQKASLHLHFTTDSNSFYAAGRWVPSDPKQKDSSPSETEIDCYRQSRICVEATAEYYSGHPHVSLAYLEVVRWDADGIIAISSSAICMTEAVLISFPDRSISATHSMKKLANDKKQACTTFGAGEPYTELFVIKNSERWNADPYGESKGDQ